MNKKCLIASLIMNLFNFIAVLICSITVLIKGPTFIKMFTVQSNIICGIVGLIVGIYDLLILLKKKEELPMWLKITKMVTTTAVALTFFTVVFYLGFVAVAQGQSYFSLFKDETFIMHFLTPVLAIISFIFFDSGKEINFKFSFLNLIHMLLYTIYYSINIFVHLDNGKVDKKYDWYSFVIGDFWTIGVVFIVIVGITYGTGFGLWILNKKFNKALNNNA